MLADVNCELMTHYEQLITFTTWQSLLIIAFPHFATEYLKLNVLRAKPMKYFQQLTQNIINERRKLRSQNVIERKDLINSMIDANLTDKQIVDNVINFFVAGGETTACTLAHAIHVITQHPGVQEKLRSEVDNYFKVTNEINYELINENCKYLDAFIKETLRYMSTLARTFRVASRDCKLGHVNVPKDTVIWISNAAIHRDENNFEKPDEFMPERFLPGNAGLRHNDRAFMPFADGVRNCIAKRFAMVEMKHVLVKLLRTFKFDECERTKEANLLQPANLATSMFELHVKVSPRD